MASQMGWEKIYEAKGNGTGNWTYRAKVEGGWLYRHVNQFRGGDDVQVVESMTFVPETPKEK